MPTKGLASVIKEFDDFLRIGDDPLPPHVFPTGLEALNYAISEYRGIPGGAIIQLLGENGSGKSTLSLDLIKQAQATGLKEVEIKGRKINTVVLDIERSYDPDYADVFGIDSSKVLVVRTHFIEQSFTIAETLLLNGIQLVIVDSIGMMVANDEEDKTFSDNEKMAVEAKSLGRFTKRANAFMNERALVVIINHYRANISPVAKTDKKPFGARVVQYANKLTLELRRIKQEEDRDHIEVFISKNKLGGKKGQKVNFEIVSTEGIDYAQHTLNLAKEYLIVDQRGSWLNYGDMKAQGDEKAKDTFPMEEIKARVIKAMEE